MLTGKDAEQEVPGSLDGFTWEDQNAVQERQGPNCGERREFRTSMVGFFESKVRNGC